MIRRTMRALGTVAVSVFAAAVLVACQAPQPSQQTPTDGPAVFADASIRPLVEALPSRSVAPAPSMRLAAGLIPPTNRWFSGLVFGSPQPVFPFPISFALAKAGFGFGLPHVNATAATISGAYRPDLQVDVGAASSVVTAYDDVSVTVAQRNAAGARIGRTTLAEGSPLVGFTADAAVQLTLSTSFHPTGSAPDARAELATASVAGTTYALIVPAGALTGSGSSVHLSAGQSVNWFPVPVGGTAAAVAARVSGPLTSVSTSYSVSGSSAVTTLRYRADGGSTVAGALPNQPGASAGAACTLGTYDTILGTMTLCGDQTLRWSVPRVAPTSTIRLAGASGSSLSAIRTQLHADAASTAPPPGDSYFGGKALFRLANLLAVAHQVSDSETESGLKTRLSDALREWMDPGGCRTRDDHCFVYDSAMHGVVGLAASFGSDQFNDHHFHYGYFLYAAGVLAAVDPSAVDALAPVVDLLAADLATSGPSAYFPERRTFDPYVGHSWASGYSPFADGNNQESSSEAVNAWNGLALWATASRQRPLAAEAIWMLSAEAASARAFWVNTPSAGFSGFRHSIVSLNWGGKRDYATWFSAEPNAILGIQLIPMSPVADYLAGDPGRIAANLREAVSKGSGVQFGDYLLMYGALGHASPSASAFRAAQALPASAIDDADSRTYLLAWLAARHR